MILNLLPGEIHEDENLCIEPVPHGSWIHATISQLSDPIAVNRNYLYKNTKVISKMLIHNRFLFLPLNHEMPKKKITFMVLSSPPETTHRPSGVNRIAFTPLVWPLYVWMQPFLLISHIFRLVSKEPDAKNSPNGWKSTDIQLDRWPVKVRTTEKKKKRSCKLQAQNVSQK